MGQRPISTELSLNRTKQRNPLFSLRVVVEYTSRYKDQKTLLMKLHCFSRLNAICVSYLALAGIYEHQQRERRVLRTLESKIPVNNAHQEKILI